MQIAQPAKARPLPVATPASTPYWEGVRAGELRLQLCEACGRYVLYPRPRCPHCHGGLLRWVRASGRGTLHSYVVNYLAAPGWEGQTPYVIAVVELEEGPRMLSNLVGVAPQPELLALDMPLEVVFERRGEEVLPQFRPVGADA